MEQAIKIGRGISVATAEELGAELSGPAVAIPADLQEEVQALIEEAKLKLVSQMRANVQKALHKNGNGAQPSPTLGGPILQGPPTYEYWDLLVISPQQFIVPPFTFQPHKIVAGGEFTLLLAVLFINPLPSPGGGMSATQYLAGRGFRVRFQHVDLTNVVGGPSFVFAGNFPAPAPMISIFPVGFVPANPGLNPQLLELNVTADVTDPVQPFAAFGSQWLDIEDDPGFPVPQASGLRTQIPLRYLVYSE
jgi:hypothetical protein